MDRQRVCLVAAMMEHIHRPDTQSSQQPIESFTVTSDLYNLMRKKTALASCYGTTFGRYYVGWETNKQTTRSTAYTEKGCSTKQTYNEQT
jgi:hypothetical protein